MRLAIVKILVLFMVNHNQFPWIIFCLATEKRSKPPSRTRTNIQVQWPWSCKHMYIIQINQISYPLFLAKMGYKTQKAYLIHSKCMHSTYVSRKWVISYYTESYNKIQIPTKYVNLFHFKSMILTHSNNPFWKLFQTPLRVRHNPWII